MNKEELMGKVQALRDAATSIANRLEIAQADTCRYNIRRKNV